MENTEKWNPFGCNVCVKEPAMCLVPVHVVISQLLVRVGFVFCSYVLMVLVVPAFETSSGQLEAKLAQLGANLALLAPS